MTSQDNLNGLGARTAATGWLKAIAQAPPK